MEPGIETHQDSKHDKFDPKEERSNRLRDSADTVHVQDESPSGKEASSKQKGSDGDGEALIEIPQSMEKLLSAPQEPVEPEVQDLPKDDAKEDPEHNQKRVKTASKEERDKINAQAREGQLYANAHSKGTRGAKSSLDISEFSFQDKGQEALRNLNQPAFR